MKKGKIAVALATIFSASLLATACGATTTQNSKPQDLKKSATEIVAAKTPDSVPQQAKDRKDTLVIGGNFPSGTFNSLDATTLYDQYVYELVFDSLIAVDDSGLPIKEQAKDYKISDDGLTYTFTLRDDVKFSDGTKVTADDLAFTYTALSDPKYDGEGSYIVSGIKGYKEYNSGNAATVEGIKVKDASTIEITLAAKNASALLQLGGVGILEKKYYNFSKGEYDKFKALDSKPVGSGEYILKSYKEGQEVDLEKNPSFYKGCPKINKIIFVPSDSSTAIQKLTKGDTDIDFSVDATAENSTLLKKAGFINQQIFPQLGYNFLGLNLSNPLFSDLNVRQALAYGLNRQGFVDSFYKGFGTVSNEPTVPVSWSYNSDVQPYKYDVKKAGELLDKAGWKLNNTDNFRYKDGKKFAFSLLYDAKKEWRKVLAPIVQDNYKKLGIDVTLVPLDIKTVIQKIEVQNDGKRNFDAYLMGWSLTADADQTQIFASASDVKGGSNYAAFHNEESDKLLQQGLDETNQTKRTDIYKKWDKVINEQLPYVFVSQNKELVPVSARVKNLKISSFRDFTQDLYKAELK